MMAELVYVLCAVTSAICAGLLFRSYLHNRSKLLFWSGICFVGYAANNVMLFADIALLPDIDLSTWRLVPAVGGSFALLYGLIQESTS
jgi:hypothetical protein